MIFRIYAIALVLFLSMYLGCAWLVKHCLKGGNRERKDKS